MVSAQGGDQILDGIGETGLNARYIFRRDLNDWSRNNLHATIKGSDYQFVEDIFFVNVLSLTGNSETFLTIPGESVTGLESISISGWIFLRSEKTGQVFFDFGKNSQNFFRVSTAKVKDGVGYKVQLQTETEKYEAYTPALELNKWNYLVVVINIPSRTMSTYINVLPVSEVSNVAVKLENLFDKNTATNNKLYVGKSHSADYTALNAMLHDFRIYRVPLNGRQIARIHANALKLDQPVVRVRDEADPSLPKYPETTPQLYNALLSSIPEIKVETEVGHLPTLPSYVQGIYKDKFNGPKVRVIWPAPIDNKQVLTPGTYKVTGTVPGTNIQAVATVTVKKSNRIHAPIRSLDYFNLNQVLLNNDLKGNETKFIENRNKFETVLAKTNPDNFLYMFRNAFGQKQPEGAEPLGVWDSQLTKLRGHATGHYLTAIAQAYASAAYNPSLQAVFLGKIEYMVNTLYELSQMSGKPQKPGGPFIADPIAVTPGPGKLSFDSDLSVDGIRTDYWNWGKGFISAYPPDQFIMLEKGATYGTDNTRIWAPYYTLDKILAGLMDIYEVTGNVKALEIVKGMGDWVHARLSQLPKETLVSMWNRYIAGEYGGMNDAMAQLYRLTKNPTYLETAKIFDNIRLFYGDTDHSHGLAKNVDMFRGLHANQHIPQIVGALEIYRVSQLPDYFNIANNFWNMATNDYMYSIGGVAGASNPANAECFTAQPATIYENGFSAGGQNETCATYNMLKLTRELFLFSQRPELMDYYELALYNHILASVAEDSPANTYHVPLRPGSVKQFGNPHMKGFTCCNGTAIESNTKLHNSIYFKSVDNQSLFVNLFIPSTLKWEERGITVTQSTAYPKEDRTRITIKGNGKFNLQVRVPQWATKGFFVKINGKTQKVKAVPGTYLSLNRSWKNGDTVELHMPFHFYLKPVMDQQNVASLFYGPVLLAAQETEALKEWRKVTLNASDISKSITGDPSKLTFSIDGIVYKPFFDTYGRHSVYLDVTLK